MRVLIEIIVPYVFDDGPFYTFAGKSYLRLCDGKDDLTINGKTYISGFLKSITDLEREVDIIHGGNLEAVKLFSLDMLNNGILESIELDGKSLNSGTLRVSTENENLWFGYIEESNLNGNILTIVASRIDKGLGKVTNAKNYGLQFKKELKKDETLSSKNFQFQNQLGTFSEHPKILQTYSTNNPSPTSAFQGIIKEHLISGKAAILISHYNDVFKNEGLLAGTIVKNINGTSYYIKGNIFLKFLTGSSDNVSTTYRVDYIQRIQDGTEFKTKIFLKDDVFTSDEIKAFDRIYLFQGVTYFPVGDTSEMPTTVFLKDSDKFYSVNSDSWSIEVVNGKKYISIYNCYDIFSEIPTNYSYSYHKWSSDGRIDTNQIIPLSYTVSGVTSSAPTDFNNALDNDMSTYFIIDSHTEPTLDAVHHDYTLINDMNFMMVPELGNVGENDIYFGALIDRPILTNGETGRVDYLFHTLLKNNEIAPCNNNGLMSYDEPFNSSVASQGTTIKGSLNSAPIGEISNPIDFIGTTSGDVATVINNCFMKGYFSETSNLRTNYYECVSNPVKFFTFDRTKLYKIPVDPAVYSDINSFQFTLRAIYTNDYPDTLAQIYDFYFPVIFKIGLWTKITVESPDTIYIDTPGTSSTYIDTFHNTPDSFIKDLVIDSGNSVVSNFGLTSADYPIWYNYLSTSFGDSVSDSIEKATKQSNLVVGQDENGNYYINSIQLNRLSTSGIQTFTPNEIFDVSEPWTDTDISEIINLPRILFKDKDGKEQYLEVINLSGTFPTSSEYIANPDVLSKFIVVSPEFYSKVITLRFSYGDFFSQIAKPIFDACYSSNQKNGCLNKGEIVQDTYYPEYLSSDKLQNQLISCVKAYTIRKKTITLLLDFNWKNLKLGTSVRINDPRVFEACFVYGFVQGVKVDLFDAKVYATIICDKIEFDENSIQYIENIGNELEDGLPIENFGNEGITDTINRS